MLKEEELKSFYQEKVCINLETLERKRVYLAVFVAVLKVLLFIGTTIATWAWFADKNVSDLLTDFDFFSNVDFFNDINFFSVLILIMVFIVGRIIYYAILLVGEVIQMYVSSSFIKTFKERIILRTLEVLSEDLKYEPNHNIAKNRIDSLNMFPFYTSYHGDDYIKGTFGKRSIEFSEVIFGKEVGFDYKEILKGILFITDIDVSKKLSFSMVPNHEALLLKSLNDMKQNHSYQRKDRLNIDNKVFLDTFTLYGKGSEAKALFSLGSVQEKLLFIRNELGFDFYISVEDKKLNVLFEVGDGHFFEPKLFKSIKSYKEPMIFIQCLYLVFELLELIHPEEEQLEFSW